MPRAGFGAETGAVLGAAAMFERRSAFREPDQVAKTTDYSWKKPLPVVAARKQLIPYSPDSEP
jgi:hypothetical protein